jgi:hypothetical protein
MGMGRDINDPDAVQLSVKKSHIEQKVLEDITCTPEADSGGQGSKKSLTFLLPREGEVTQNLL